MHALDQPADLSPASPITRSGAHVGLLLWFLAVVVFTFACRTMFFWHDGALLAGLHADEPFHYAAERIRLAPESYSDDPAVRDTLTIGAPYDLFYRAMVGLAKSTGWPLANANFAVTWAANLVYLAGLMVLLSRLGLPPKWCAIGTVLASQRFALILGQTLVAHGMAIPREVWQALLPWFLLWFISGSRGGWRLVLFYGALGAVFTATYPLWAVNLGLTFGLVDLWQALKKKDWPGLIWLGIAALVCVAVIAAFNLGLVRGYGAEESALLDRMQHGKAIYFTKGFRRFVFFALIGLWGFLKLGGDFVDRDERMRRLWRLWVVTVAVCLFYQPLEIPFPSISMMYLGRVSLLLFVVSFVVVAVSLRQRFRSLPKWQKWTVSLGIVLLCVFPIRNAYTGRLPLSFVDFCAWIRANTPVGANVFVPPIDDGHHFRIYAERGMWIAPYDKTTLWRTKRLYALMQDRVDTLKGFFNEKATAAEREAVLQRLRADGVDYAVTRADAPWSASLSWPVVHEHGPWQLRAPPAGL